MKLIKRFSQLLFAFSLLLFVLSRRFIKLSAFFNRTICQTVRLLLAHMTSRVSFSIFEGAVILSPFFIIMWLVSFFKSKRGICKQLFTFLSIFLLIPSLYILTVGISYISPSPFFTPENVSKDDLIYAARTLANEISDVSLENGEIPNISQICDELSRSYVFFQDIHGYRGNIFPRAKEVFNSKLLARMGTLAFYSFPTGEVNINTLPPKYTLPFTIAHEYAHYVGISSERDANFMAFLTSLNSTNGYIRYSGLISGLEFLLSDICKVNKEVYNEILSTLPEYAVTDLAAYREYSNEYEKGIVFGISDGLNSAHLDVWDENGRNSYSDVSRLIVAYINNYISLRIKCSETTVFWSEKWDDLLFAEGKG